MPKITDYLASGFQPLVRLLASSLASGFQLPVCIRLLAFNFQLRASSPVGLLVWSGLVWSGLVWLLVWSSRASSLVPLLASGWLPVRSGLVQLPVPSGFGSGLVRSSPSSVTFPKSLLGLSNYFPKSRLRLRRSWPCEPVQLQAGPKILHRLRKEFLAFKISFF